MSPDEESGLEKQGRGPEGQIPLPGLASTGVDGVDGLSGPGLDERRAAVAGREALLNLLEQALQERVTAIEKREAAVRAADIVTIATLKTSNDELRKVNEKLVIAALTAQELRDAAQIARRRQEEFLAMLAHELRNPLGPIRTAVEILGRLDDSQSVPRPVLDVIRRQVGHMVRLLDDLLDVARVTEGKVTLELRPMAVREFIQGAIETTSALMSERQQQLTVDLPSAPIFVEADAVRLTQVFTNLLQNASKYTQLGGVITLRAERSGESAVIRVLDNGMGISAEALPHVFDLFAQDKRTAARSQGGLGIGLTVVRRMVELHHGSVEARSNGRGEGSEFIVTLLRLAHGREAEIAQPAVVALAPTAARVLIVEDNVEAGEALAEWLALSGHTVRVALDGPQGLQVFERFEPQVVLCDIGLPGMDGYEVAVQMRERRPLNRPTLIALTGYGGPKDRERSLVAGFDHHLVKPADPNALLRLIDSSMHAADWMMSGPGWFRDTKPSPLQ